MSTRAHIEVKGNDVLIYKHSDGYPEGVIPVLKEVLPKFIRERGNDTEYAIAQIVRAFARSEEKRREKLRKEYEKELEQAREDGNEEEINRLEYVIENYSEPSMTGWGLCTKPYSDINYHYEVDLSKKKIKIHNTHTRITDHVDIHTSDKEKAHQ